MSRYSKAVWAFAGSVVGALLTVVAATEGHTFSEVDTLGWLGFAGTVLGVTGGVYAIPNKNKGG